VFSLSPLTPGKTTFVTATTNGGGLAVGTTFLTSDSDFFYSNLISASSTPDLVFVFGGVPVSSAFFAPTSTNQILAFQVQPEASSGSPVPFTLPQFGGAIANPTVSPLYVIRAADNQFGAFNATTNPNVTSPRILQASLGVSGQGANQSSLLVVGTGAFATSDSGLLYASGPVRGTFLPAGAAGPIRLASSLGTAADANGNALYGGTTIDGFVLDQNSNTSSGPSPQLASASPFGSVSTPKINYAFTDPVLASAVPTGVGTNRTTQTLNGQFGGIIYSSTSPVPFSIDGFASVSTNASSNRISAQFVNGINTGPNNPVALTLNFGGLTGSLDGGRGTFIDNSTFAATDSASTASQINGVNLPIESPGQPGTRIALVSSGALPGALNSITPAGVSFCPCQYLQWGYWTGEADQVNGQGNLTAYARANINTFVVGPQTINMPTTGSGTYTGAAVGSVYNNGASYLAVGGASTNYNFASGTGTFAVTNFDGRNFSGSVGQQTGNFTGPTGVNQYSGNISGTNLAGNTYGYFYGPNAEETGGRFAVQSLSGPTYLAAGIFAAKR
jgi:hypothetical protein